MADVIEEDFITEGKLAIGFLRHSGFGHAGNPVLNAALLA
jgi:hypothetical protein